MLQILHAWAFPVLPPALIIRMAKTSQEWQALEVCPIIYHGKYNHALYGSLSWVTSFTSSNPKAIAQDLGRINSIYIASIQYHLEGILTAG